MNQLNPRLKELLKIAQRVEDSTSVECEAPADFVRRVLFRLSAHPSASPFSMLEFMVKRGAVFAALIGLIALTAQLSLAKPSFDLLKDVSVSGAVLFRIVLR